MSEKTERSEKSEAEAADEQPRSVFREYLEALLVAAIFLGFSNTFVLKTFYIPSGSMEDTLLVGDHLFVNRFIYGSTFGSVEEATLPRREVRRGDIVIFRSPETPEIDLIKRCVAIGGDTVQLVDKQLLINGEAVDDDGFAIHRDPRVFPPDSPYGPDARARDNFGPLEVPENHLFCLGDNRDYSYDSRYWGPVPEHYVKGRALMIYWSYGGDTPDGTWRGWGARLRQLAGTAVGFFTRTRWSRTFHLIR